MLYAQRSREPCPIHHFKSTPGKRGGHKMKSTITETVRERYAEAARKVADGGVATCGCRETSVCCDPITSNLYGDDETATLPELALRASLGCGNPTALAQLNAGEHVLDLGSGGGIDVILSARRVGPTGKAYGLD